MRLAVFESGGNAKTASGPGPQEGWPAGSDLHQAEFALGRLELHALRFEDQTLAVRCNLLADPGIFYFKVAYDEAFAQFSPGIRLEVESFHRFHDRPQAAWVDSCSDPNNETMNRLLQDWQGQGLIEINRGFIVLKDAAALASVVEQG